jgi:hypothetical protein
MLLAAWPHGAHRARTAEGQGANLATACGTLAQLLSLLAACGRTAQQGKGAWHFGAAHWFAGCPQDRRPNQAVNSRLVAHRNACFRWAFQECLTNGRPIFERLAEYFFEEAQRQS